MENAAVKTSGTYSNPLGEINLNWNEAAMNASMESVLTGYGDPRLPKFFKPCGSDVVIAGDAGDGTVALKGNTMESVRGRVSRIIITRHFPALRWIRIPMPS